jgi:hypothetical protein
MAGEMRLERSELAVLSAVATTDLFGFADFGGTKAQEKCSHPAGEQRSNVRSKECRSLGNSASFPIPPNSMLIHRRDPFGI